MKDYALFIPHRPCHQWSPLDLLVH